MRAKCTYMMTFEGERHRRAARRDWRRRDEPGWEHGKCSRRSAKHAAATLHTPGVSLGFVGFMGSEARPAWAACLSAHTKRARIKVG